MPKVYNHLNTPHIGPTAKATPSSKPIICSTPSTDHLDTSRKENKRNCCLTRCLTWIYELFASFFRCSRREKNVENPLPQPKLESTPPPTPSKTLAVENPLPQPKLESTPPPTPFQADELAKRFMQDFYGKRALLFSEQALERFGTAHPREQDRVLYYLTKKCCFSALFYYIHNLLQDGREQTLYDIAQTFEHGGITFKCGEIESFVNPNKVTYSGSLTTDESLWMMKIFEKGIPSSARPLDEIL